MTEKGKKPGADAAGPPDPLSATGMFLSAFAPQPEPFVDQALESPPKGAAKPAQLGEFTQMFHKLEPPPSPPPPRSANGPAQEPGEFTRMFVAAATSSGFRPPQAAPEAAPFAPPATPKMRGFSAPGVSDSASADGSFTQLFRTPPSIPAPPPRQATEHAWPQSLDPAPSGDGMTPGSLTQLFRSLSEENELPSNRIGESRLVSPTASPVQPPSGNPASVTMLMQRLTGDLHQQPAPPTVSTPADLSGPGEFTRIIAGGGSNSAAAAGPGAVAENFAMPVPPTLVFPAAPVPAFAPPQVPAPPAPAFAPQVPMLAVPPAQPPKAAPSAPPQKSKLQQMLPMLLVLNAFLVVVLILLLVFALRSR